MVYVNECVFKYSVAVLKDVVVQTRLPYRTVQDEYN